ncbi:MAG: hypothetical protein PWR01_1709 [Clostridiales bacterium]|nr:hypothetical protein [Clostridiales bacterium]
MKLLCVFFSTDIWLDSEIILRYYAVRWTIETSYQYLKVIRGRLPVIEVFGRFF